MMVLNVHRIHGSRDVSCRHNHHSIRSAQHCRRLQTRKWPAGVEPNEGGVTTYTIRASEHKPRMR